MLDTPEIPLATFDGLVFGPRSDMPIWQQIRDHILAAQPKRSTKRPVVVAGQ
jgi:hypothetical protein